MTERHDRERDMTERQKERDVRERDTTERETKIERET